jgi:hypothetical protein
VQIRYLPAETNAQTSVKSERIVLEKLKHFLRFRSFAMRVVAVPAFCLLTAGLLVCGCGSGSQSTTPPPPPVITVSLSPQRAALIVNQTLTLAATTNDSAGVTWSAMSGTFSSKTSLSGASITYTAPNSSGPYSVTATSVTDTAKTATMMVYITDLAGVTTYHNDLARDGVNNQEYALTQQTVTTSDFGKLFSCPTDGAVYTQPLWMPAVTVNGAAHNVVFVGTQHDGLFAFDADASPCQQLWTVSLIDANHGAAAGESPVPSGPTGNLVGSGYGDITPEVGVTGTPVIDPLTGTLYVVSKSMNSAGTSFYQRLHAIDITTGKEKFGGPANIGPSITFPGTGDGGTTVSFNPQQQNQRPGLALVNGVVYVAWSSHEDTYPYYGWVIGFNASNLSIASVLNITPNVLYGGIWMGGGAPSADSANHIYLITGNGGFDVTSATPPNNDYGDSFLQITGGTTVSSYFTPSDQETDEENDSDFGSGGSAVVLNVSSGALQHLVIGGGKDGALYLLNGDSMGGLGDSNARQVFNIGSGIFATGAFWNNSYFIAPVGGPLAEYSYDPNANMFTPAAGPSPTSVSATTYGFPGATPSVSALGATGGIVWALENNSYCTQQSSGCGPAVLHAYSAATLATELWNSSLVATDAAGNAVKFTVPTIANGRVYIGTRGNNVGGAENSTSTPGEVDVYGLQPN